MNQREALLTYLKKHKHITVWTAMQELSVARLSERIAELEREGHKFSRVRLSAIGRYGNKVHPMKYIYLGKRDAR